MTIMSITSLSVQQLRQAANLKEQIAGLEKQLSQLLGATIQTAPATAKAPKKSGMSAAGKARIIAAQKARWAKIKALKPAVKAVVAKPVVAFVSAKPAKKTISAAGIARIKAAQKARWAKINAAKSGGVKPAVKAVVAKSAAPKKKFTMSAAAKAKISAAAKARWAKVKAAKK